MRKSFLFQRLPINVKQLLPANIMSGFVGVCWRTLGCGALQLTQQEPSHHGRHGSMCHWLDTLCTFFVFARMVFTKKLDIVRLGYNLKSKTACRVVKNGHALVIQKSISHYLTVTTGCRNVACGCTPDCVFSPFFSPNSTTWSVIKSHMGALCQ